MKMHSFKISSERQKAQSGTSSVVTFWSQLKVNLSHLPKSIKTSQFHSLAKQMQAHKDPPIFAHTRIQRFIISSGPALHPVQVASKVMAPITALSAQRIIH